METNQSLALRRKIGAITPQTLDRPKHFAKEVHRHFKGMKLAQCQEATAHVFGQADWHALDKSVKAGCGAKLLDDDLGPDERGERRTAQAQVLALELFGVDPQAKYERPERTQMPGMGMADPHNMERLEAAAMRNRRLLCEMFVWEMRPSQKESMTHEEVETTPLDVAPQEMMAELPKLIGAWWKRNLPHQPEVGQALASFDWDKDRPTSVIAFGAYWGELCMHYAFTIDWSMCMGTACLLAQQYASSVLQSMSVFWESVGENEDITNKQFPEQVQRIHLGLMMEYLDAYMRDDMGAAPFSALTANAKKVMKILQSPTSKGGVWKM